MSLTSSYRTQPRRRFSREYKREVCELLQSGAATAAEVAREYELHPNQLFRWRNEYLRGAYGPVRDVDAGETKLLPVELIESAVAGHSVAMTSERQAVSQPVTSKRWRRLRIVLPKGEMHLEDVDAQTLGLLIEALR